VDPLYLDHEPLRSLKDEKFVDWPKDYQILKELIKNADSFNVAEDGNINLFHTIAETFNLFLLHLRCVRAYLCGC
jgi:hypothetical protein